MSKLITVKIDGRNLLLDAEKAEAAGALMENYPLQPGDVYCDPKGNINSFLLVATRYETKSFPGLFQLLGMGCGINSGEFFLESGHTIEEVGEYLRRRNMVYVGNINTQIENLVYHQTT